MVTTLALVGAYNLAGALAKQVSRQSRSSPPSPTAEAPDPSISASSLNAAFSEYESATRPIVAKAQQLPPIGLLHPQTAWGIWVRFSQRRFFEPLEKSSMPVSARIAFMLTKAKVMHCIIGAIVFTGLAKAIAKFAGRNKEKSKETGLVEWDSD